MGNYPRIEKILEVSMKVDEGTKMEFDETMALYRLYYSGDSTTAQIMHTDLTGMEQTTSTSICGYSDLADVEAVIDLMESFDRFNPGIKITEKFVREYLKTQSMTDWYRKFVEIHLDFLLKRDKLWEIRNQGDDLKTYSD